MLCVTELIGSGFECNFKAEGEQEKVIQDFRIHTEESVKDRSTIVPAIEKIIEKELPILSARMRRLDA